MERQTLTNGRFSFEVHYRRFAGDEGVSIRVLGPVGRETKELIRYDCLQKSPHFHMAVHDNNTIQSITAENPVSWSLNELDHRFEQLVRDAGGDTLESQEQAMHKVSMMQVRSNALKLDEMERESS